MYLRYKILLFIIGFLGKAAVAQIVSLNVTPIDTLDIPIKIPTKNKFQTVEDAEKQLVKYKNKLNEKGFFTASFDSIYKDSLVVQAFLYVGKQYSLATLENGNISSDIYKEKNLLKNRINLKVFNYQEISSYKEAILKAYQNNGYPFAEVYLDSVEIINEEVNAKIMVEPHELFLIDSITVEGNTKTKSIFVSNYLNIKKGEPYSEQKINSISRRWSQLPYLEEVTPTEVKFVDEEVSLRVNLRKQKSNQFYFILGILPNSELNDRRLTITGEGKLFLQNSFGLGEEIEAEFRQIKAGTQTLDIALKYPYIINFPIGVSGSFNLFKNDTLFVDINSEVGLFYQFSGVNSFRAFFQNQTSNVLNYDTVSIKQAGELPDVLDLRINKYGLSTNFQNLNYVLNPRNGYNVEFLAAVGTKVIRENGVLKNLTSDSGESLENIYNDIAERSILYEIGFHFQQFIPIRKRSTFLVENKSKLLIAQNILDNQKYRIGGFRIMRGFDEQAIVTPFYLVNTLEYRFLLSKNSYFNTFVDVGVVEDRINGAGTLDIPIGFGSGVSIETKGGIFSLTYALGKQLNNKIEFRNGKIHFGYVNLF